MENQINVPVNYKRMNLAGLMMDNKYVDGPTYAVTI